MSNEEEVEVVEEEQENTPAPEDILGMSDEDMLKMDEPVAEDTKEEEVEEESEDTTPTEEDSNTDETTAEGEPKAESKDEQVVITEELSETLKAAEYDKLMAPFRANGKDMQVFNVPDAITLMQQGANYSQSMAGIKPIRKMAKMLEKNGLMDEEKLSYLIDLNNKNPDAIQKLLKDSGVDPLDIDVEKDAEYTPNSYTVDDKEVELDTVLDNIRGTQSFDKTIDIISNKMDESSKEILYKEPDIISVINEHVSNGIYDQITGIVESERMLGRLKGLSDLEAYKYVGDTVHKAGGFNQQQAQPANEPVQQQASKPKDDPKLKDRKRAASSTKSAPNKAKTHFNPLAMSDEEFEKIAGNQYI